MRGESFSARVEDEFLPEGGFTILEPKEVDPYVMAGPVKITRRDGTVEWRKSYTEDELEAILKTKRK